MKATTKILVSYILGNNLYNVIGLHTKISYSDRWDLQDSERKVIRHDGYCFTLCGLGFDPETGE